MIKYSILGVSLVVQRLKFACGCRGHGFYPWSGKMSARCEATKLLNLPPPLTNQEREQDVREQGVRPPMEGCGVGSCVGLCVRVCVCTCVCVHGSLLGALSRLSVKEGSPQSGGSWQQ